MSCAQFPTKWPVEGGAARPAQKRPSANHIHSPSWPQGPLCTSSFPENLHAWPSQQTHHSILWFLAPLTARCSHPASVPDASLQRTAIPPLQISLQEVLSTRSPKPCKSRWTKRDLKGKVHVPAPWGLGCTMLWALQDGW